MELTSYKEEYSYSKYINKYTRVAFFLIGDAISLFLSAVIGYYILSLIGSSVTSFPTVQAIISSIAILIFLGIFKMYFATWRYTSIRDLIRIISGVIVGGAASLAFSFAISEVGKYELAFISLFMINAILFISGFRISKRMYFEIFDSNKRTNKQTIIFGGKSEGEQILRDILKNDQLNLSVVGIFDDRLMSGLFLHGVRILGGKEKMINYIRYKPVDILIVAFPEIPKKDLKEIIDQIKKIKPDLEIKILPSFHSLTDDPVGVENIRDISIEDILGREPVNINMDSIKASIKDKTVLITGAGGSIGSELVRQCINLQPRKLVALDIDETELFYIENEFKGNETEVIPCVANVTDERKIDQVIGNLQPDVIFHAAAYKHVPMMEIFPDEAIKVNIGGTKTVASIACKHGVEKFVMVSTDKAVNPTNIMGATKRIAEEICMAYNGISSTKFISVRFGNVLGSRGSVVPIFVDQIKNGGPVTITDPEMKRYFMTIPEAVLLVMEAGSMGNGGEVFVLDMGEPVKILDMAKELIRLHNLQPDIDIHIEVTGIRPGEKLYEELLNAEEGVIQTEREEILKANCSRKISLHDLEISLNELFDLLKNDDKDSIRSLLQSMVPTYSFKERKIEKVSGF